MKLKINRFGTSMSITASETDVSVAGNTSYINLTIKVTTTGSTYNNSGNAYVNATLKGANNTYSIPKTSFTIGKTTTKTVYTGKIGPFTHNADGSLPAVSISASAYLTSSTSASKTAFCAMSTIPRTTGLSNITGTIGSAINITIVPSSNSFTHTLTYTFGSASGTIATKTTSKTISFTPPASLYAQIPSAKSGTGKLTLTTYSGDTAIGTSTSTLTLNANESACKPVINSATLTDTNSVTKALTGNAAIIVKNASNISLAINATTKNYAAPKTLTVGGQGISFSSTSSSGTYTINQTYTENKTSKSNFNIILTDARGYVSATKTVSNTIVNYIAPTLNASWKRPTATGSTITLDALSGNVFAGSFGSVSNALTIKYRYKEEGGSYSSWVDISSKVTLNSTNNTYNKNSTVTISGLDYRKSCLIEMTWADKINSYSSSITVKSGQPLWYWTKNKFKVLTKFFYKDKELVDLIYPVGSIFMSTNNVNPGTYLGGTWEQIQNRFLLAAGSSYTAGSTGGSATVTLTANQSGLRAHGHGATYSGANFFIRHGNTSGTATVAAGTNTSVTDGAYSETWSGGYDATDYSHKPDKVQIGGTVTVNNNTAQNASEAHNNMPPYLVVYMWKRTA